MIKSNLHTHSIYCDGKNTPEEIVNSAISLGLLSVGFSGHAYTPFDSSFCMSQENTKKYTEEILNLKEKYKDKIEIYLGLEADLLSEFDKKNFDYIIGSCHYVTVGSEHLSVDDTEEIMKENVKNYFSGDYLKYAENYFEQILKLNTISPDIIGHFDLLTKFNEGNKYFNENDKKYLDLAFSALDTLIPKCDLFEVNTGAICRGYKKSPYPAVPILKRLKEKGAKIIITSDCHDARDLTFYFKETQTLLKETGFLSTVILSGNKFIETPL